jgi:hypothetical protein
MKIENQLFLLLFTIALAISCSPKEDKLTEKPLSEQQLEFEIYDSLVVYYLGRLTLMDQSPDGKHFLLIDQNTDSILVSDPSGKILHRYLRTGDGPEVIKGNRIGIGRFLGNDRFMIPGSRGLFVYSLHGELLKSYNPDFNGVSQLVIPANQTHAVKNNRAFSLIKGRDAVLDPEAPDYKATAKILESTDLSTGEFTPIISIPQSSKFSTVSNAFELIEFHPNFSIQGDSLYLTFRNEPKLFVYSIDHFDSPSRVVPIPIDEFIEQKKDGKSAESGFNVRDFFLGTINSVIPTGSEHLLINYLTGLTDDKVKDAVAASGSDLNKIFEEAEKMNTSGTILFNGKAFSQPISKSSHLGYINLSKSLDEIWFSPNFDQVENDYSVIYKTRLVSK